MISPSSWFKKSSSLIHRATCSGETGEHDISLSSLPSNRILLCGFLLLLTMILRRNLGFMTLHSIPCNDPIGELLLLW